MLVMTLQGVSLDAGTWLRVVRAVAAAADTLGLTCNRRWPRKQESLELIHVICWPTVLIGNRRSRLPHRIAGAQQK